MIADGLQLHHLYAEDASFIAPWGSTVTGRDEGDWIQCEVWLLCGDAGVGRNGRMWKACGSFRLSLFGRCQAHEFLERAFKKVEICRRCVVFACAYIIGAFFTWNFLGFCEATRYFEMYNDRSRFCPDASTSWSLGVLQAHCSHGTAPAVAVPENGASGGIYSTVSWKQWKRLTGCNGCWNQGCHTWNGIATHLQGG